ncbi:hypothetical protein GH714_001937 [Hevea brasiliensis]|uniref:Uncharacterized protein n=1 Tax=Hevea brasiliensis TaxID=3981 RepID=A0A6A6MZX7_HEVBR|nr:hypothetical protein GH714_001937 [Hevea brasiliensis]
MKFVNQQYYIRFQGSGVAHQFWLLNSIFTYFQNPDSDLGQFKAINDEGMPMYENSFLRGKLYIHFSVKALDAVLPSRTLVKLSNMELDECEEATLHDVNFEKEMQRKQQQAQEAYDEDEGKDSLPPSPFVPFK